MERVRFNYEQASGFVEQMEFEQYSSQVEKIHNVLHEDEELIERYGGWIYLPQTFDQGQLLRIQSAAKKIQRDSNILLVIGIGGSYLGSRAVIKALHHTFYNLLSHHDRHAPQILFVGTNISATYMADLLALLEDKDVSINVISKSGSTTEPAIAFRIFRNYLEKRYGKQEARKRIYVTTDPNGGALKALADEEGYETFMIPPSVGGRYSVLTAVGLLPIAVSGLNIEKLMDGAYDASYAFKQPTLLQNEAYQYAVLRHIFYQKGKAIELLASYEPTLHFFGKWWQQLFAESEGKDQKGIFPAVVDFSTDLHSIGQYIQEGHRNMFVTTLHVETVREDITIEEDPFTFDGLQYIENQSIDYVNKKSFEGAMLAHTDGGVPNLVVNIPKLSEYHLGYLIYFFMKSCAVSGYLLGVNPFDQPGVEAYKNNMFALLDKPGYEKEKKALEARLTERRTHDISTLL